MFHTPTIGSEAGWGKPAFLHRACATIENPEIDVSGERAMTRVVSLLLSGFFRESYIQGKVMGEFLTGDSLSEKIKEVCSGKNVRIAAAFWGKGAVDTLFDGKLPEDAQIICDISMGGTNPDELREMGAPNNPALRFLDGLHAKVYLSDKGCVVGSANASDNGVGFFGAAKHTEAGVYHKSDSSVTVEVAAWLDNVWIGDNCKVVDKVALESAENRNNHNSAPRVPLGANLIDSLLEDPKALGTWGVVISGYTVPNTEAERLRTENSALIDRELVEDKNENADPYTGWEEDAAKFPEFCISIHGSTAYSVLARRFGGAFEDDEQGSCLFAYPVKWAGSGLGTQKLVQRDERLLKLIEILTEETGSGSKLYTSGKKFIKAIRKANSLGRGGK
jgi:hypothetical protein